MRALWILAIGSALLLPSISVAQVSDDLVFCSKLADKAERIACYDAAARIAATRLRQTPKPSIHHVPPPVTAAYAAAHVPRLQAEPIPFTGFYIAGGATAAVSEPRGVFLVTPPPDVEIFSATENPHGFSGLVAGGYNIQLGSFVTGLELRGRFGPERATSGGQLTSPATATFDVSHEFNVDAAAHLAARFGVAFGPTLIFGYFGVGAAHTFESSQIVGSGVLCTNFLCTTTAPAGSSFTEVSQWQPSLLFGTGLEHNFGPVFGRFFGEAEGIKGPAGNADFFWTARAGAMIGYRF
jgi:hypothetical protein